MKAIVDQKKMLMHQIELKEQDIQIDMPASLWQYIHELEDMLLDQQRQYKRLALQPAKSAQTQAFATQSAADCKIIDEEIPALRSACAEQGWNEPLRPVAAPVPAVVAPTPQHRPQPQLQPLHHPVGADPMHRAALPPPQQQQQQPPAAGPRTDPRKQGLLSAVQRTLDSGNVPSYMVLKDHLIKHFGAAMFELCKEDVKNMLVSSAPGASVGLLEQRASDYKSAAIKYKNEGNLPCAEYCLRTYKELIATVERAKQGGGGAMASGISLPAAPIVVTRAQDGARAKEIAELEAKLSTQDATLKGLFAQYKKRKDATSKGFGDKCNKALQMTRLSRDQLLAHKVCGTPLSAVISKELPFKVERDFPAIPEGSIEVLLVGFSGVRVPKGSKESDLALFVTTSMETAKDTVQSHDTDIVKDATGGVFDEAESTHLFELGTTSKLRMFQKQSRARLRLTLINRVKQWGGLTYADEPLGVCTLPLKEYDMECKCEHVVDSATFLDVGRERTAVGATAELRLRVQRPLGKGSAKDYIEVNVPFIHIPKPAKEVAVEAVQHHEQQLNAVSEIINRPKHGVLDPRWIPSLDVLQADLVNTQTILQKIAGGQRATVNPERYHQRDALLKQCIAATTQAARADLPAYAKGVAKFYIDIVQKQGLYAQLVAARRAEEAAALVSLAPLVKAEADRRKPDAERVLDIRSLVSYNVVEARLAEANTIMRSIAGTRLATAKPDLMQDLQATTALLEQKLEERRQTISASPPVSTWAYVNQLEQYIAAKTASPPAAGSPKEAQYTTELALMKAEAADFKQKLGGVGGYTPGSA